MWRSTSPSCGKSCVPSTPTCRSSPSATPATIWRSNHDPEAAKKDADVEYEKCTASNPGPRGEAYCASKTKETLENAGLKDQADSILSDPQDQRVAKEVQAEKEYDACLRSGKSDSTCQANYMKATDAAKLEYYRADPDKAKQEINANRYE